MVRRWIIRGLALALLTLCVTAWIGSYFEIETVFYESKTEIWWASVAGGELELTHQHHGPGGSRKLMVPHAPYDTIARDGTRNAYRNTPYHLLGFAWQPRTAPNPVQGVMIPLWFPTTLAAGFLWLIWRKTRPQYTGQGFPVEVATPEARKT
jgi:hypothetical protein